MNEGVRRCFFSQGIYRPNTIALQCLESSESSKTSDINNKASDNFIRLTVFAQTNIVEVSTKHVIGVHLTDQLF